MTDIPVTPIEAQKEQCCKCAAYLEINREQAKELAKLHDIIKEHHKYGKMRYDNLENNLKKLVKS